MLFCGEKRYLFFWYNKHNCYYYLGTFNTTVERGITISFGQKGCNNEYETLTLLFSKNLKQKHIYLNRKKLVQGTFKCCQAMKNTRLKLA